MVFMTPLAAYVIAIGVAPMVTLSFTLALTKVAVNTAIWMTGATLRSAGRVVFPPSPSVVKQK
jgi:hypothetical protein